MTKVTMTAIAEAAGVGVATVDRVLNRRSRVRAMTETRVLEAASRLGYHLNQAQILSSLQQASLAKLRMGFILLSNSFSFYHSLTDSLNAKVKGFHLAATEPLFNYHNIDDIEGVVASIYAQSEQVNAIGLVALDHPLIRRAIENVSAKGVNIYALFSNFSECGHSGYIGLDNQKAGRTAGWIASNLLDQTGSVGVLMGDHRFNCQESCEISFRSYLREQDTSRLVLEPLLTHESIEGGYHATIKLLEDNDDLRLIYAPCGGIEGVIHALRQQPKRNVALICHGPVKDGDLALIDGTITVMIKNRIDELALKLADVVTQRLTVNDEHFSHVTVPFEIVTRENL